MAAKLEITQMAHLEDLAALRRFVEQACEQNGIESALCDQLKLAVDEACTNIIIHGYANQIPGPITLTFQSDAQQVQMTILDQGMPFDPSQAPTPALDEDLATRPIGGLGLYLMHEIMDEVRYHADPNQGNCLTLVKFVGGSTQSMAH